MHFLVNVCLGNRKRESLGPWVAHLKTNVLRSCYEHLIDQQLYAMKSLSKVEKNKSMQGREKAKIGDTHESLISTESTHEDRT